MYIVHSFGMQFVHVLSRCFIWDVLGVCIVRSLGMRIVPTSRDSGCGSYAWGGGEGRGGGETPTHACLQLPDHAVKLPWHHTSSTPSPDKL